MQLMELSDKSIISDTSAFQEMIMRVISMTPDQINRLPPQERAITIQLVSSFFGFP